MPLLGRHLSAAGLAIVSANAGAVTHNRPARREAVCSTTPRFFLSQLNALLQQWALIRNYLLRGRQSRMLLQTIRDQPWVEQPTVRPGASQGRKTKIQDLVRP